MALSAVSGELSDQRVWLERYAHADDQAYFVIEHQGEHVGTVQLHDPQAQSFCWSSWILKNTRPSHAAMESALMFYAYAVDHLCFSVAHFDVRKGNERVWQFHERFGAVRAAESDLDYFYRLESKSIAAARERYQRFLEGSVSVVFS